LKDFSYVDNKPTFKFWYITNKIYYQIRTKDGDESHELLTTYLIKLKKQSILCDFDNLIELREKMGGDNKTLLACVNEN